MPGVGGRAVRESGWLRYVDLSGRGLANQGWKDSVDSVQFADGRLADPPIALCEVQGYAYEAAVRGAALLAAFGEEPVEGLADWAADLRERFGREFWVDTAEGGHVAIALDGSGAQVDSVTSNMGHLLGTGILDADRVARVVEVLTGPDMASGFGLRTLDRRVPALLAAELPRRLGVAARHRGRGPRPGARGRLEEAAALAAGLVAAAEGVAYRLPELYGGDPASDVRVPGRLPGVLPPAGLGRRRPAGLPGRRDRARRRRPGGHAITRPVSTSTRLGTFEVRGIRVGEETLSVRVDASGLVAVTRSDDVRYLDIKKYSAI